jgi:PAS domain S-box-containing protein
MRLSSVFDVIPRRQGGVYFSDRVNGLGIIEATGRLRYERIGEMTGTNSSWILQEDARGALWMTTRGGLFYRQGRDWATFGFESGLTNVELWPIAMHRGHVCVGSSGGGMTCLSPESHSAKPPEVEFLRPEVGEGRAEIRWLARNHEDTPAGSPVLARVRLDGGAWTDWTREQKWLWEGISTGSHRVELEARGAISKLGGEAEVVRLAGELTIPAPLWKQPVFYVPLGVMALLGILALGFGMRRRMVYTRELAEKEGKFRALIQYSSVGITLRDRHHKVFYVSPAAEEVLGYSPTELLGGLRNELVHPDDLAGVEQRGREILEHPERTLRARVRLRHKSGDYRWFEVVTRNLLHNPTVGAIVTNLQDVTEATLAEMATAEARKKAEQANQAKSDFLAMISHEIRTPMNGITGMCHLLMGTRLNQEQREYAGTIEQSSQALLALINDVLDFSRIEAGKLAIEKAPFDLERVLGDVVNLMRVRAEEKGIGLELRYPAGAPRIFVGDSLRIRQILINLAGNAVKFTERGTVRLVAQLADLGEGRYRIEMSVEDTGIGIAPEKLTVIFEKFTQADASTTRRFGGSGLGLSISRSLAELMGGELSATSEEGEGSRFTLTLEMDKADAVPRGEASGRSSGLEPLPLALEVLVVEDNLVNQKLAAKLLERMGCQVKVAASGAAALGLYADYRFDLILMDCQMPEMDGYETTALIRQRESGRKRTPIIALTANVMENDLEKCLEAGMDAYLTKPIDLGKLREALEEFGVRREQSPLG